MTQFTPDHYRGHQSAGSEIALPDASGWTIGERTAQLIQGTVELWEGGRCPRKWDSLYPEGKWDRMNEWLSEGIQYVRWEFTLDVDSEERKEGWPESVKVLVEMLVDLGTLEINTWDGPNAIEISADLYSQAYRLLGRKECEPVALFEVWRVAEVLAGDALEPVETR